MFTPNFRNARHCEQFHAKEQLYCLGYLSKWHKEKVTGILKYSGLCIKTAKKKLKMFHCLVTIHHSIVNV